jgi:hypothetical protein
MEEAVEERPLRWGVHFDWDWQRFLIGASFETGRYACVNIGFAAVILSRDRWDPWF